VDTRRLTTALSARNAGEVTACGQTAKYGQKIVESGTSPEANYSAKAFPIKPFSIGRPGAL